MKPKIISIIGGKGKMGKLFATLFKKRGYEIIISDINTKITNIEAAKKGDVIIICVPIRNTTKVIKEVSPFIKSESLLTDLTSVKINPVKFMLKYSKSEVIGAHPLFGPTVKLKNQNIILCKGRGKNYYNWYKKILKSFGLKIIEMNPKEHDKNMAVIQCLTHFSNLTLGLTLKKLKYDLKKAEKFSSPIYLLRIFGVGRILSQNEKLYSDIQIENPYSKEISKIYLKSVKELNKIVQKKNKTKFENLFKDIKKYFGKFCEKSMKMTNKLIKNL